jgi:hypothetical protein
VAERYHGQWTTREIAEEMGWASTGSASSHLRELGISPVATMPRPAGTGAGGTELLWDAQQVFDALAARPGAGSNLRKADRWPHPDGWRCRCRGCRARKQRQRDDLVLRYLAERVWVGDHWEAPVPPDRHGLLATATKRGCECEPCRDRAARHWRDKPRRPRKRCVYPGCDRQARVAGTQLCNRHHRLAE